MTNVKIGTVQMSCVADKATNLNKAIDQIRIAAAKGAQIICLQELFTSLYFCDVESYDNFELAEAIPGPSTEALQVAAAELGVVIVASLLKNGPKVSTTIQQPLLMLTVPTWVNTVRCTFRMTRAFTRSSISRREILATRSSNPICNHRCTHLLGSMVSRSGPYNGVDGG